MLNYLKRRFSSSDLIGDIKSGVGYTVPHTQQPQHQQATQRQTPEYKYLHEEVRKPTVDETSIRTGVADAGCTRATGMAFPSAPNSPSKHGSVGVGGGIGGIGGGGFMNTFTGQLTKAKHLFSTETLNSIIGDSKSPSTTTGSKFKTILIIDHALTDWAKYFYRRKLEGDWEIRVEQTQLNDISIKAFLNNGCIVTVQDSKAPRSTARTFRPDFVLIRQGLGATTQQYENMVTAFMFGGVPCMNSADAIYNMRNKAWLFSHLIQIQRKLGVVDFRLIDRSYHVKSQPLTPDFPMPVTVRIGGDSARECEIRVEDTNLFQSMMGLANSTQRHATVEPCVQSSCEIVVQKIGPFTKAFMRRPMPSTSVGASVSTILEKIPVSQKFNQWITEVAELFGGLDMCSIRALQDVKGDYLIQEVSGSDFMLLGDGQEEDRQRIAEIVLQRMEQIQKWDTGITRTSSQLRGEPITARPAPTTTKQPSQMTSVSQNVISPSTSIQELPPAQGRQPQASIFSVTEQPVENRQCLTRAVVTDLGANKELFHTPSLQKQSQLASTTTVGRDLPDSSSGDAVGANTTTSKRTSSMDFSNQSHNSHTNFGRTSNEFVGDSDSGVVAKPSMMEYKSSDSRGLRGDGLERPLHETSVQSNLVEVGEARTRTRKEAAPQPPRQSSLTNSFECQAFDPCSSINMQTKQNINNANIFDTSMNTFSPQKDQQASKFQSPLQEKLPDMIGTMEFDNITPEFKPTKAASHHNDPWSVPTTHSQTFTSSKDQLPSTFAPSNSVSRPSIPPRQTSQLSSNADDVDDTMKNLRKTFAGIFGDI